MQISFPGPDGQLLTVADTRRDPIPARPGRDVTIALPQERRPAGWIIATMRV